jgi:type II secretory pathway pseudopilin PulG
MQASRGRIRRRGEFGGPEGGFTVIERVIVIVILVVLGGVVVFAVRDVTGQSAAASCQSNFATVESATEAFKAEMGAYPGGTYLAGAALTAASPTVPAEDNAGILDLLGTATTNSGTIGPWLEDYPYSAGHYQIEVEADGGGTISVYSTASPPAQIGSGGTLAACDRVR